MNSWIHFGAPENRSHLVGIARGNSRPRRTSTDTRSPAEGPEMQIVLGGGFSVSPRLPYLGGGVLITGGKGYIFVSIRIYNKCGG